MLPDAALKPVYDKVAWVYVYRDFSNSDADRAAERVSIRCGITAWPGLVLMDPSTMQVIGEARRDKDGFVADLTAAAARAKKGGKALDEWKAAEAKVAALHANPTAGAAAKLVEDADIVVRTLALRVLVAKEPGRVAERAADLLAVPNDAFRFEVCDALEKNANPKAARALDAVLADPKDSRNPNRLRMEAAQALAACGDAASVAALAPFASSGAFYNGLTGGSVDALAAIAARHPESKEAVKKVLVDAYPAPPDPAKDARAPKFAEALAKKVHAALKAVTGKDVKFPEVYDEDGRTELLKSWQR